MKFTWIQIDNVYEKIFVQQVSATHVSSLLRDISNGAFPIGAMDYAVLPGNISEEIINKVIASFGANYPIERTI
jgi:hypothetical protein